jgi:hypothetical protein
MGRIGKLRLAGLLLGVALLAGACDHRAEPSRTPGRAPATSAATLAPTRDQGPRVLAAMHRFIADHTGR